MSGRAAAEPPYYLEGEAREGFRERRSREWNSTGLFTNPLTASPLSFRASLPKQKLSRTKSRQLRRLIQSVRLLRTTENSCEWKGGKLEPSKAFRLSVLTLFEGVGLENENRRMVKTKGSSLFPQTILYTNPVICPDLQITKRLELVTLPLCRHDWIWSSVLMAVKTI